MNEAIRYIAMFDKNTHNENSGGLVNEIFTSSTTTSEPITICVYICTTIMVINFFYKIYKIFFRNLKRKYTNNNNNNLQI